MNEPPKRWGGMSITLPEIPEPPPSPPRPASKAPAESELINEIRALDFLWQALKDGPVPVQELRKRALAIRLFRKDLKIVRLMMNVKSRKDEYGQQVWILPDDV